MPARLPRLAVFAAALAVLGAAKSAEAARSGGEVVGVHIVSAAADEGASDVAKRVRRDQAVRLHAVLEVKEAGKSRFYSTASSFTLGKKKRAAAPLAEAPTHFIYWHKIEPTAESMSNTASGKFRFESIDYAETLLMSAFGKPDLDADIHPTLTTDRGDGVGTMRFKVTAISPSGTVASPGIESRGGRGSGGLAGSVHRITVRRDDSYLGFLTELYGQPYIWASAGKTDRSHQSETLEGSDCADFIVYGRRRMGHDVPYTWTGGLPDHTRLLARGNAGSDGIYRDKNGEAIAFPAVGDLVLFPRHVGALTTDRGTIGVLDHEDIMMHSYFASPREQSLGDSDYASTWIEVRRWK